MGSAETVSACAGLTAVRAMAPSSLADREDCSTQKVNPRQVCIFFNILPDRCNSPLNSEGAELQLTL